MHELVYKLQIYINLLTKTINTQPLGSTLLIAYLMQYI